MIVFQYNKQLDDNSTAWSTSSNVVGLTNSIQEKYKR